MMGMASDSIFRRYAIADAAIHNSRRRSKSLNSANRHSSAIVRTKSSKGFRLERRKPFVFYIELVAGVRFELTTFGL